MPDSMFPKARMIYFAMGDILIEKAHTEIATVIAQWKHEGLKNTTINRRIAALRRACRLAFERWEWIEIPVHQKIKQLSERNSQREIFLKPEQVTEILSYVNETERNFLLVMAYCGLRPWAELLPLTPNYFDGEQIHVTHTKTGKSRFVPVPDEIAEILNSSLPWKTSYSQVRDQWEQARIQVGHPEWWIYDLRHTFASSRLPFH